MSIGLIGDLAFTGLISEDKEVKKRFIEVAPLLDNYDLIYANLEAPVYDGETFDKDSKIILKSDYDVTKEALQFLNIGCVSLANNHIYDCKLSGLKKTIELLDELKIKHTGAGWKQEHVKPVIISNNELKIGFLAYVDKSTNPKTEGVIDLFINYFDIEKVKKDLKNLRNKVDKIIISIHWGKDYSNYFTREQQQIAHNLIKLGADIIMGHHPHTIQAFENYNEKLIFYSLGQLCFGDFIYNGKLGALKKKTKIGVVVELTNDFRLAKLNSTRESKGNYVRVTDDLIERRMNHYFRLNEISFRHGLVAAFIKIKETFFDRFYEYLFGYYRNPIKQLFSVKNIKKVKYLIRDYKS